MKTILSIATYVLIAAVVFGCGQIQEQSKAKSAEPTPTPSVAADPNTLSFRGSVVSAFDVTVDGASYGDMEQFYTAEQARLPKKLSDAGYATATNVRFDAELGFLDLWHSMAVFILGEGQNGYMASGQVDNAGSFVIKLPDDASGDSFRVRANKRIRVKFQVDGAAKTFCYNFSAVQQKVNLSERSKPIILNTFESSLTAYDCPADASPSSLQIPASGASAALIAPGMTKSQVSVALGVDGLTILDTANWCYNMTPNDTVCDVQYKDSKCRCSVQFDSKGLLISQSNILGSHLKNGTWTSH